MHKFCKDGANTGLWKWLQSIPNSDAVRHNVQPMTLFPQFSLWVEKVAAEKNDKESYKQTKWINTPEENQRMKQTATLLHEDFKIFEDGNKNDCK